MMMYVDNDDEVMKGRVDDWDGYSAAFWAEGFIARSFVLRDIIAYRAMQNRKSSHDAQEC